VYSLCEDTYDWQIPEHVCYGDSVSSVISVPQMQEC